MVKADVVAAGVAAIQAADVQALSDQLGIAFDAGVDSVPPPDADEQAKIDAAVAKAKADDQVALAAVQAQLDDMTAKELSEEQSVAALNDIVAKIKALLA